MLAGLKIRSQDVLELNALKGKLQPPGQSGRWSQCSVVEVVGGCGGRWSEIWRLAGTYVQTVLLLHLREKSKRKSNQPKFS